MQPAAAPRQLCNIISRQRPTQIWVFPDLVLALHYARQGARVMLGEGGAAKGWLFSRSAMSAGGGGLPLMDIRWCEKWDVQSTRGAHGVWGLGSFRGGLLGSGTPGIPPRRRCDLRVFLVHPLGTTSTHVCLHSNLHLLASQVISAILDRVLPFSASSSKMRP